MKVDDEFLAGLAKLRYQLDVEAAEGKIDAVHLALESQWQEFWRFMENDNAEDFADFMLRLPAAMKHVAISSANGDTLGGEKSAAMVHEAGEAAAPKGKTRLNRTFTVVEAYRSGTPLNEIRRLIDDAGIDWSKDAQSVKKAYILACLSEIVYEHVPKYELKGRDRYKIIPSLALEKLLGDDISFDLAEVCRFMLDAAVTVTDTGSFIFGTFNLPKFTVIAVRGTTPTIHDWAIDLDERKLKINGDGYHAGFYLETRKALPDLVTSVTNTAAPLYFTGHSLGGAIAGILPQIWAAPHKRMTPYTFASPRFGDKSVADKHRVYAYVRANDPVPHLPPENAGFQSSGWPPTMVPPTDHWRSGVELLWRLRLSAHSIESYRVLLGDQVLSKHFAPLVYFDALKTRLTKN